MRPGAPDSSEVVSSRSPSTRAIVTALVVMAIVVIAALMTDPDHTQTLTIRVSGEEGIPYEISYENSKTSYTEKSRVPDEHIIPVTTGRGSEDYVRATAENLGAKKRDVPGDELITVNLELVAEDGTVLDEDCMECNPLNYAFNRVGVEYKGEDL